MVDTPPPIQEKTTTQTGQFPLTWLKWFNLVYRSLSGQDPFVLKTYTVAELPAASNFTANIIYVSDESGGAVPAFSDGTNWRRVTDRAIVS